MAPTKTWLVAEACASTVSKQFWQTGLAGEPSLDKLPPQRILNRTNDHGHQVYMEPVLAIMGASVDEPGLGVGYVFCRCGKVSHMLVEEGWEQVGLFKLGQG